MRLWFTEEDAEARARMARTALGTVAVVTTLVALAGAAVRGAARRRCSAAGTTRASAGSRSSASGASRTSRRPTRSCACEERRATYVAGVDGERAADRGAHGDARRVPRRRAPTATSRATTSASAVVLLGLWVGRGARIGLRGGRYPLGPLLRYGLPIVPAEAAVFALNVIDRAYLLRDGVGGRGRPLRAGGEARDGRDRRRARVRPRVAAAGVLRRATTTRRAASTRPSRRGTSWSSASSCSALALLVALDRRPPGRAGLRRRARGAAAGSRSAGASTGSRSCSSRSRAARASRRATSRPPFGRARRERRRPASCSCPPLGIAGAGIALCVAYVVTLAVLHLLTRGLFARAVRVAAVSRRRRSSWASRRSSASCSCPPTGSPGWRRGSRSSLARARRPGGSPDSCVLRTRRDTMRTIASR